MLALKFTDRIADRLLPPIISSTSALLAPTSRLATGDEEVRHPPADGMKALLETMCTASAALPLRMEFGTAMFTLERVGDDDAARCMAFMDKRASSLWWRTAPVSERTREIITGSTASPPLVLSGRLQRLRHCMSTLSACGGAVRSERRVGDASAQFEMKNGGVKHLGVRVVQALQHLQLLQRQTLP